MTEPALISIIMPVYNRTTLIDRSIRSVLDQSYPWFELIIADDGSAKSTRDHILTHHQDPQIRYLCLPHQGVSATRNAALSASKGSYLCFLDSDDWWPKDKLKKQMIFMTEKKAQISIGYFLDTFGSQSHGILRLVPQEVTETDVLQDNFILFQTMMVTRDVMKDLFFEPYRHEDFVLAIKLLRKGYHFKVIPEVMTYRLRHQDSLSASKWKSAIWRYQVSRKALGLSHIAALKNWIHYGFITLNRKERDL